MKNGQPGHWYPYFHFAVHLALAAIMPLMLEDLLTAITLVLMLCLNWEYHLREGSPDARKINRILEKPGWSAKRSKQDTQHQKWRGEGDR
jgi:hypothetical protein